jgi:hypothetical protein
VPSARVRQRQFSVAWQVNATKWLKEQNCLHRLGDCQTKINIPKAVLGLILIEGVIFRDKKIFTIFNEYIEAESCNKPLSNKD